MFLKKMYLFCTILNHYLDNMKKILLTLALFIPILYSCAGGSEIQSDNANVRLSTFLKLRALIVATLITIGKLRQS